MGQHWRQARRGRPVVHDQSFIGTVRQSHKTNEPKPNLSLSLSLSLSLNLMEGAAGLDVEAVEAEATADADRAVAELETHLILHHLDG